MELGARVAAELEAEKPEAKARLEAAALEKDILERFDGAKQFLLGGGTVDLLHWEKLPDAQRWALSRAGQALRDEQAVSIAKALAALAKPEGNPLAAGTRAALQEARGR
jgi:hypothetical protein